MALLVGASAVIALRILGVARDLPLETLRRFYPAVWAGFWLQVVSGVLLLIGYPTKSLTTPAFYLKLACIAAAMVVMLRLRDRWTRALASWSLALWLGAITAGRLIAYTARYVTYPYQ